MSEQREPVKYDIDRHSGKVSLSEAGEGGYLQFDIQAFEVLQSAYDEDYIEHIIKRLAKMDPKVYQTVVAATLKGTSNNGGMPWGLHWQDLNVRILDALNLSIYGTTYDEQKEINEQAMMKRLEGMQEDPRTAAMLQLLSSMPAGKPESEQG